MRGIRPGSSAASSGPTAIFLDKRGRVGAETAGAGRNFRVEEEQLAASPQPFRSPGRLSSSDEVAEKIIHRNR